MPPRIAIPVPHSGDPEYAERSLPQYERAVTMAGGQPIRIPLDQSPAETMKLIEHCDAVLLPGSPADVDPAKYDAPRDPQTAAADPKRDTVDELLLQDAYNMRKPVLGICYGLQILNVYRSGTLVQHIESRINHEAGRKVPLAHTIEIDPTSKLAEIVETGAKARDSNPSLSPRLKPGASTAAHPPGQRTDIAVGRTPSDIEAGITEASISVEGHGLSRAVATGKNLRAFATAENSLNIPVNSSHHQSADVVGDGLRVVARCSEDGVIEAVEGTSPDHFVLGVQWHPERSVDDDESSRAIFRALVEAADAAHEKLMGEFEAT